MSSGLKAMRMQYDPDGKYGHNERAKMKRIEEMDKKGIKFEPSSRKHYEPMPLFNCPVYVEGCQPNQCPCKRRMKHDALPSGWEFVE